MKFMVMHKVDAKMERQEPPPEGLVTKMGALVGESIANGTFLDGAGLFGSPRRARVIFEHGKSRVERGPYKGRNEVLASFAMIEAESLDHAVSIAAKCDVVDGEIEVGPVVEPWDLGLAAKPEGVPARFLLLTKGDKPTTIPNALSGAALVPGKITRFAKGAWRDGPFAESKELIAGFSVLEMPSLDAAKRWTERYAEILGDNEVDVRYVA